MSPFVMSALISFRSFFSFFSHFLLLRSSCFAVIFFKKRKEVLKMNIIFHGGGSGWIRRVRGKSDMKGKGDMKGKKYLSESRNMGTRGEQEANKRKGVDSMTHQYDSSS